MFSSLGYHTFSLSMNLTQAEADLLFRDFKKYRDRTQEIYIKECPKYKADPLGRHYEIKYLKKYKGIHWKMRFSNQAHNVNGKFVTCSIKAIINPKILAGEKSYIIAADVGYLEEIERIFNKEAGKISPILKRFDYYSLNRLDYCINFDVSELKFNCPSELKEKIPEIIMRLIKCGDIPDDFSEEYKDLYQFYLKSKSIVINCYWKYDDLLKNYSDCNDLEKSYDIIRFEVQYRYPKVRTVMAEIKKEYASIRSGIIARLNEQGSYDYYENPDRLDRLKLKQSVELLDTSASEERVIMMYMLSDDKCTEVIKNYFNRTIKPGSYYTFNLAKRIIEVKVSKWEKVVRLTDAMKLICSSGGIAKAKAGLYDRELDDFRRSLRDLADLGINPVTIPEEWGIKYIPNLLDAYYDEIAKEQAEEWVRRINE